MAALFRIVQDDYPPLPEGISQALRDFLLLCFQKEPVMRSSAAKLLEHPWLQNPSNHLHQTSELASELVASATAGSSGSTIGEHTVDSSDGSMSIVNTIRHFQKNLINAKENTSSSGLESSSAPRERLRSRSNRTTSSSSDVNVNVNASAYSSQRNGRKVESKDSFLSDVSHDSSETYATKKLDGFTSVATEDDSNDTSKGLYVQRGIPMRNLGMNTSNNNTNHLPSTRGRYDQLKYGVPSGEGANSKTESNSNNSNMIVNNNYNNKSPGGTLHVIRPGPASVVTKEVFSNSNHSSADDDWDADFDDDDNEEPTVKISRDVIQANVKKSVRTDTTPMQGGLENNNNGTNGHNYNRNLKLNTTSEHVNGPLRSPTTSGKAISTTSIDDIKIFVGSSENADIKEQHDVSSANKNSTSIAYANRLNSTQNATHSEQRKPGAGGVNSHNRKTSLHNENNNGASINLLKYHEDDSADFTLDLDTIDDSDFSSVGSKSNSIGSEGKLIALKLKKRMLKSTVETVEDNSFDDFLNYQFEEKDFVQNENKDVHIRRSRVILKIMEKIKPTSNEEDVIGFCDSLLDLFTRHPEQKEYVITHYGVLPILDMLESRSGLGLRPSLPILDMLEVKSGSVRPQVLRVINKIVEGSTKAQEQLALVGLIPIIIRVLEHTVHPERRIAAVATTPTSVSTTGSNNFAVSVVDPISLEAAKFVHQISSTSSLTLQMLIGAGGLPVLVQMVSFSSNMAKLKSATPSSGIL